MTNILLNTTTLDEEVLHDFWLRIFESVEKLTEGQEKGNFQIIMHSKKKWKKTLSTRLFNPLLMETKLLNYVLPLEN